MCFLQGGNFFRKLTAEGKNEGANEKENEKKNAGAKGQNTGPAIPSSSTT